MLSCFWITSLQMARLADNQPVQLLQNAIDALERMLPIDFTTADSASFVTAANQIQRATGVRFCLFSMDGKVIAASQGQQPETDFSLDIPQVSFPADLSSPQTRLRPTSISSKYDAETGIRTIFMTRLRGAEKQSMSMLQASITTEQADHALSQAQATTLLSYLACFVVVNLVAILLAIQIARPIQQMASAANKVAEGDIDSRIPVPDVSELSTLAFAFRTLFQQLEARSVTIGRQDTEQEAVLDSMIEGVLAIDAQQKILGINKAAADLFDVNMEADIGYPMQSVIRNPDLRRFALQAIDCSTPLEDDIILSGPPERTIHVRGTALRDISGKGGAVIVLSDITDLKHLENVRREFVANVSHELKTPIASIKGFIETLLNRNVDSVEDRQRFLEIIRRQADRLQSIIEDLLALSRIEQSEGTGSLVMERTGIIDVLHNAKRDCLSGLTEQNIDLEFQCDEAIHADVNAPLLEQALINLINNAVKASENGSKILVSARLIVKPHTAEILEIAIHDEGCGIEPQHLSRLFERFYRVDKGRSRASGGTGLGLSIVKHIVQAHGGPVSVDSTPGVGTSFTLQIPFSNT